MLSGGGRAGAWAQLRTAAWVALGAHLVAGLAMMMVLRRGLETNPDLADRLALLAEHEGRWIAAWLTWNVAALSILYFFLAFARAHSSDDRLAFALHLAVLLGAAGLAADLVAESIEMGVLPKIAARALREIQRGSTGPHTELFLVLHRVVVMLTGYLANGLYTCATLLLCWATRSAYPRLLWMTGLFVGVAGFFLSAAALADSVAGMFWANAVLVPGLLLWQGGVAVNAAKQARSAGGGE